MGISKKYSFYRLDPRIRYSTGRNSAEQKGRANTLNYFYSVRDVCFFILSVLVFCIHLQV